MNTCQQLLAMWQVQRTNGAATGVFPPEMLVFGKGVRVPGSVTSDPTVAAHAAALSNQPDGMRFRQDLALRESARKAFAMVDNDQTLRRALSSVVGRIGASMKKGSG